jgi:hypothetical protein
MRGTGNLPLKKEQTALMIRTHWSNMFKSSRTIYITIHMIFIDLKCGSADMSAVLLVIAASDGTCAMHAHHDTTILQLSRSLDRFPSSCFACRKSLEYE